MDIKIGKMLENKTWKFLSPCLSFYGSTFTDKINTVFKLAAGIGDDNHFNPTPSIYLLCDAKYQPRNFIKFLEWIKYEKYYLADYPFTPDLKDARRHMVVIAIPKAYLKTYEYFLEGKYSKMYTEEEIKTLFLQTDTKAANILLKKSKALEEFVKNQNKVYGTKVKANELVTMPEEYEFPLNHKEEIFNYED
jgi:hypothetical protein